MSKKNQPQQPAPAPETNTPFFARGSKGLAVNTRIQAGELTQKGFEARQKGGG